MNVVTQMPILRILLVLASLIIVLAGLKIAAPILNPFFLSILFAVIFWPMLDSLQRRGLSTGMALGVVILGVIVVGLIFIGFLAASVSSFSTQLPVYQEQLSVQIRALSELLQGFGVEPGQLRALTQRESSNPLSIYLYVISGLSQLLTQSFLIFFYVVFILVEIATFQKKLKAAFKNNPHGYDYAARVFTSLKDFLVIKTNVSLVTGVGVTIPLYFLGVDFAIIWGFLTFLLNFIPYVGSILAGIPPVIIAFIEFGPGIEVLLVIGIFLAANLIVGYILEPRMMGAGLGLSALVVFIALIIWGWILGPIGLILSIPITAAIKIILESYEGTRWLAVMLGTEEDIEKLA